MNEMTIHNVKGGFRVVADLKLYCGRNPQNYPALVNAGLGNPHPVGYRCTICNVVHDRAQAVAAYAASLETEAGAKHRRIIRRIAQRFNEGRSIALFCHCAPLACHCDVIRDVAMGYAREGGEG